jgi:hypothetical protein
MKRGAALLVYIWFILKSSILKTIKAITSWPALKMEVQKSMLPTNMCMNKMRFNKLLEHWKHCHHDLILGNKTPHSTLIPLNS